MLEQLGIDTFSKKEYDRYLVGKYDAYVSVKPVGMTLLDSMKRAD